jgi:SAM-dependent methyltransferase
MSTKPTEGSTGDTGSGAQSAPETSFRGRMFAWLWKHVGGSVDEQIRPAKSALLEDLSDRVVEICPGHGATFSYYGAGTRVLGIEPNAAFHEPLAERASAEDIELETVAGDLRSAGLPAESEDAIVSTLVLCSVGDVHAELAEIKRVLRPGGRLVLIEHVVAERGTARYWAQRVIRRPWRFIGDMCNETRAALERAGFSELDGTLELLGPKADPRSLIYWGTATR